MELVATLPPAAHQTRGLEDLQVLRDGLPGVRRTVVVRRAELPGLGPVEVLGRAALAASDRAGEERPEARLR